VIVKMKFVSATGPREEFDNIVEKYLAKYDMHLENAYAEYDSENNLVPYQEINPYREILSQADELVSELNFNKISKILDIDTDTAFDTIQELGSFYKQKRSSINKLTEKRLQSKLSLDKILPFSDLDYSIEKILKFEFIRYRFGRIPVPYWNNFATHFKSDLSSIFAKCQENEEYIWGVYFVPKVEHDEVDAIYESLHFERIFIPDEYQGTPATVCEKLQEEISTLTEEINSLEAEIKEKLEANKEVLYFSHHRLHAISRNFDVRKMSACTNNKNYFIVCGWMPEKEAKKLEAEMADVLECIIEVDDIAFDCNPPTKLENPKIFKPFELYIQMYGLPAYNEFDPTILVALTYAFIFGVMFGDLGQGFFICVGGFLLYKIKNFTLGAIISAAGIFSMFFGLMFGSVFGFEDVIQPLWLRPLDNMSQVPGIGSLNTIFIVAIVFGVCLILLTMILNIIGSIKRRDVKSAVFDTNGIAGLVFYGSIIAVVVLLVTGKTLPGLIVMLVMFVLPLILIGFKEPLTNLIKRKPKLIEEGVGMFLVEVFFELFEVLLSYFSNTVSFIRIGAFAVSHAAIMGVVFMLAGAESGSPNIFGIIFGNLFVIGLEGFLVGIQVLRLEYYEIFSRFYKGSGHGFKSFKSN